MAMDNKKTITIAITGNIFTDQRIIRIATSLQENGYSTTVYFRPHFKFKNENKKLLSNKYPFNTYALKTFSNKGVLFYFTYNVILFFKLLFKKNTFLYAVDSDTLLAFTLLSKINKTPLIFDAHEYFAEVPELLNKPLKQKIWHYITQWGVNQSKIRFTVSQTLAFELTKRYDKPFETILNVPFSVKSNTALKNIDKPYIIYQGALNKGRELELLLIAMQQLPHLDCLIIGEGDLSIELRQQSVQMALNNIYFKGLLAPQEIKQYTENAFLGYNLLDANSKSYYYSLSNKYFDYMQAGIPSISSKLPEYEHLNGVYNCCLCIENNLTELIKAIQYLLENKKAYQMLCENAILANQKLNWETESKKLIQLIKNFE